jgi:hypothetical protein
MSALRLLPLYPGKSFNISHIIFLISKKLKEAYEITLLSEHLFYFFFALLEVRVV